MTATAQRSPIKLNWRCRCKNRVVQRDAVGNFVIRARGPVLLRADQFLAFDCHWCGQPVTVAADELHGWGTRPQLTPGPERL